ncbi:hypothetical protein [Spiroplasma endosymbiont of Polydrusus pterygomalis]|uniref:hypothetical protein n=1 Tax=Spiroplasma endosymbiont of Polydrusus pterygomalis TaxID=3139327 RepID=UPI003CCA8F30
MRRKLNLFLTTSFLLSSSTSVLAFIIDTNNISTNFTNGNVDLETATKYANETSIVGKALLIGKNKGFNTNDLLNIMYSQNHAIDINNLTAGNTGNDFINVWTNKLDGNSINTIQSLFQRNGINQSIVNTTNANITNYRNYCSILPQIKNYLNNSFLSNDNIVDLLKNIKDIVPNIDDYLSYANYIPAVTTIIQQLLTDWDQETNFTGGNTTLQKMEDYMAKKATFAQAWNIPKNEKWYYVKDRAGNWNWNQFYQYIAGANFNYLFKLVSGKYIGEMITDNITYTLGIPSGFNVANFNTTISASLDKILINSEAWPYLIKTIIPILKSEVLKLTNPTLGINTITWDDKTLIKNNTIQLKEVLTVFQKLISSKADLLKLVTNLMTGPFGEDIITKVTVAWTDSYWTLPEIQDKFSFISAISDIPKQVVNNLETTIKQVPINETINKIFDFTSKYLTINPVIDLQDLSTYLKLTFGSNDFIKALNNLKYIIDHPTNNNSKAKEILAMLGVQFDGETSFKEGSVLASLSNWLKTPTSSLNSLLNIIANKTQNDILNNMLIEQENLYKDMYSKYFDLDNSTYFTLNNIVMNKFVHDDGSVSVILSYQIKNNLDNKSYDIIFKNDNFLTSKDFKITLFMLENYN